MSWTWRRGVSDRRVVVWLVCAAILPVLHGRTLARRVYHALDPIATIERQLREIANRVRPDRASPLESRLRAAGLR